MGDFRPNYRPPSGAYNQRRTDNASEARKEADRQANLSPQDSKIESLEAAVKALTARLTSFENARIDTKGGVICSTKQLKDGLGLDIDLQTLGSQAGASGFLGYKWIKQVLDNAWSVFMGAGGAALIKFLNIEVADPLDATNSAMSLKVGDAGPDNDELKFTYKGNTIKFQWSPTVGQPSFLIQNAAGDFVGGDAQSMSGSNVATGGIFHIQPALLLGGETVYLQKIGYTDDTGNPVFRYFLCSDP